MFWVEEYLSTCQQYEVKIKRMLIEAAGFEKQAALISPAVSSATLGRGSGAGTSAVENAAERREKLLQKARESRDNADWQANCLAWFREKSQPIIDSMVEMGAWQWPDDETE